MTEAFNTLFTAMKIIKRNAKVKNIFANRGKWFRSAKGYINNITTAWKTAITAFEKLALLRLPSNHSSLWYVLCAQMALLSLHFWNIDKFNLNLDDVTTMDCNWTPSFLAGVRKIRFDSLTVWLDRSRPKARQDNLPGRYIFVDYA